MAWQKWLAIYGAVVSTFGVGWQIWQRVQDSPSLALINSGAPSMPRATSNYPGRYLSITYPVALMNTGRRTITIVSADFALKTTPATPNDAQVVAEYELVSRVLPKVPPEAFPLTLQAGEAKTLNALLRYETGETTAFERGFTSELTWAFVTTSGQLARKSEVFIDAYMLNQRLPN